MSALSAETRCEHDLIEAARDGDDRAFEELYARYSGRITGFIHARVRDHGRSEDVAQEVFISALRRLRASPQEIQFKPWIYEIAKNACIDEHRRSLRTREVSLDTVDDESGPALLPSRGPTPPAAVETKQRLTDLRVAFGGLSESHHQLLVLREFEGLSYDEIGARTGMSRQMVESALFRARRKLTEEYEELASGRRCRQIQSTIDDGRALSAGSLGIRERRVFARHLAHCQACRVCAHLAGVDETLVSRRRLGAKIAALLPFPLWRWSRAAGRSRQAVVNAGAHPAVQTLSGAAQPAAASSLGGAAVAVAVLALAGAGAVTAPAATRGASAVRPPARLATPAANAAAPSAGHIAALSGQVAPSLALVHAGLRSTGLSRRSPASSGRATRHARRTSAGTGTPGARSGGGAATVTSAPTSPPLTPGHTASGDLASSGPLTHASGLPIDPISTHLGPTFSTGTQTTAALSGAIPAPTGVTQVGTGSAQAATGAASQTARASIGAVGSAAGAAAGASGAVAQAVGSLGPGAAAATDAAGAANKAARRPQGAFDH